MLRQSFLPSSYADKDKFDHGTEASLFQSTGVKYVGRSRSLSKNDGKNVFEAIHLTKFCRTQLLIFPSSVSMVTKNEIVPA